MEKRSGNEVKRKKNIMKCERSESNEMTINKIK